MGRAGGLGRRLAFLYKRGLLKQCRRLAQQQRHALLIDNGQGGTGSRFNWELFQDYRRLGKPWLWPAV